MPTKQDKLIKELRKDIESVSQSVSDLLYNEDVFENRTKPLLKDIKDSNIIDTIVKNHYNSMFAGLRRQVGMRKDEISLIRILSTISTHHKIVSKEWYVSEWLKDSTLLNNAKNTVLEDFVRNIPRKEFEDMFGTGICVDKSKVQKDISDLKTSLKTIKDYTDSKIAHTGKTTPKPVLHTEYKKALDIINSLTSKYILLLNQVGMPDLKPVIQN